MKRLVASLLALGAAGLLSAQVNFAIGARGTFGFGLGSTANPRENYMSSYTDAQYEASLDLARYLGVAAFVEPNLGYRSLFDNENFNVKPFESFVAGGAIIGRICLESVPGLYFQPEFGFSHNQVKYKYDWEGRQILNSLLTVGYDAEGDGSYGYNSLEIPILVGYDIELGHGFVISPYGGLNLSIPVGKLSWSEGATSYTVTARALGITQTEKTKDNSTSLEASIKNGVIPGLVLGTGAGYKFDDHNMIMADLRYLMDFTAVRAESDLKDASRSQAKKEGDPWVWDAEYDRWFDQSFRWDTITRRALSFGISYMYFF